MIGPDGVDFCYVFVECSNFVDDELEEIVRGRLASKVFEFCMDGSGPGDDDTHSNLVMVCELDDVCLTSKYAQ